MQPFGLRCGENYFKRIIVYHNASFMLHFTAAILLVIDAIDLTVTIAIPSHCSLRPNPPRAGAWRNLEADIVALRADFSAYARNDNGSDGQGFWRISQRHICRYFTPQLICGISPLRPHRGVDQRLQNFNAGLAALGRLDHYKIGLAARRARDELQTLGL